MYTQQGRNFFLFAAYGNHFDSMTLYICLSEIVFSCYVHCARLYFAAMYSCRWCLNNFPHRHFSVLKWRWQDSCSLKGRRKLKATLSTFDVSFWPLFWHTLGVGENWILLEIFMSVRWFRMRFMWICLKLLRWNILEILKHAWEFFGVIMLFNEFLLWNLKAPSIFE